MTQRIRWIALLAAFLLTALPLIAGDEVTLEGGFVWERDDGNHDGELTAVLTPTGESEWDVAFHFDWEDGPHVYTGTCTGSLDGELSGNVTGDGERQMKFTFSGSFADGTFTGEHNFVTKEGEIKRAGTLTLSMAKT